MHHWILYTMVRVVVFFAAGILLAIYFGCSIPETIPATFLILSLCTYCLCFPPSRHRLRGNATGIAGLSCIFLSGYWILLIHTDSRQQDHFAKHQPITFYTGTLGIPQQKATTQQVIVSVENIFHHGKWQRCSGKILMYINDDSTRLALRYSSRVFVKGIPQPVPGPMNPGEFNFRNYLRQKNIAYQLRVDRNCVLILNDRTDSGIQFYAQQASLWAASRIRRWLPDPREHAIALALVLGLSTDLDPELRNAYSASGAMHVLSVSGLHVAAIYAIVLLLLKPLATAAWSRWVVALISLVFLWSYAFITGLSPSVLRAVMMFSFIVVGGPFRRNTNIYNTLAASAFLLLLMDPWLILNVGFQLSYLAVAGIVWLQKPIYALWNPASVAVDKVWQITSVSLAAQAATSVVGLFYFHQFPVYFLISNLIVIPVSTAALIAGIALVCVGAWPLIAPWVGWVTGFLIRVLNGSVFFIEHMPASVVEGVTISATQCLIAMTLATAMTMLWRTRKYYFIWICCALSIAFGAMQWTHFFYDVKGKRLIVYHLPGRSALEVIGNGWSTLYADSALLVNANTARFHFQPYRIMSGVSRSEQRPLGKGAGASDGFELFLWNDRTIMYLSKHDARLPVLLEVDYVIAGNNSITSLAKIQRKISFKELILDSSNGKMNIEAILKEASTLGVKVYSVRTSGARIIPL